VNIQKYLVVASKIANKYASTYINKEVTRRMEGERKRKQDTEGRKVQKMTKREGKKDCVVRKKDG